MFRLIRRRPVIEWRPESGPGYNLRQYRNGRPTGMVASTASRRSNVAAPTVQEMPGYDVLLITDQTGIAVVERCATGRDGVRLLIPLRSCVDAQILDEPGLPGSATVRLDLTVHFGQDVALTVPMWFPGEQRPRLHRLVRQIRDHAEPHTQRPAPPLPLIDVERAPNSGDWVVFRPDQTSAEVLRPADDLVTRPTGEVL